MAGAAGAGFCFQPALHLHPGLHFYSSLQLDGIGFLVIEASLQLSNSGPVPLVQVACSLKQEPGQIYEFNTQTEGVLPNNIHATAG